MGEAREGSQNLGVRKPFEEFYLLFLEFFFWGGGEGDFFNSSFPHFLLFLSKILENTVEENENKNVLFFASFFFLPSFDQKFYTKIVNVKGTKNDT
jgi:hypothetical protein